MRIGIDIRALLEGRHTGVEEYTINLLRRLFMEDSRNEYLLFISGKKKLKVKPCLPAGRSQKLKVSMKYFPVSNRLLNLSFKSFGRPYLDKLLSGVDVFWAPNINLVPTTRDCKKIITFHDLSFERHPEFFSLKRRLWHKFINPKKLAQEAGVIIAVSQSSKQDLIDLYNVNPQKIKVIYSGVGEQFQPLLEKNSQFDRVKEKYNLPEKFILYLGTIEPRKNLIGLIKAYEILMKKFLIPNSRFLIPKLVIAGTKGWLYENIFGKAIHSKYSKDIIFTGFVEDKDKPFLYNLATLFVYPSFYEGFGFPPLEAMACGLPSITSNVSSLPEIAGDAAIMVDPYKPDELARAIEMILTDKKLRQRLSEKGMEQAKKFSWEKCAESTLHVLMDPCIRENP